MGHNEVTHFKPRPTALIFNAIIGILSIVLSMFLLWSLITVYMDNSVKIPLIILCVGSLLYGYYSLSFLWKLQLTVSKRGILYKEPLLTVYCEWDHVTGAAASEKIFLLRLDETIKPRRNVIKSQDCKEEYIPIHIFVKNWKEQQDWHQSALLESIAYYLPGLDKEVIKDGN